jgi:HSP20 family protein
MPMDAWREGDDFVVAFDLPGVTVDSVDIDVEQNVLTVKAERPDPVGEGTELIASERPRGVFSRQLILGDALDTDGVKASYDGGVLTLRIPVAEKAKPRRIEIDTTANQRQEISA